MTRAKTSIEKLATRNEKVKDLSSALVASRWKWEEINTQMILIAELIKHVCGFCILAMSKGRFDARGKCANCQTEIRERCERIQSRESKLMNEFDKLIYETRVFLDGLKY